MVTVLKQRATQTRLVPVITGVKKKTKNQYVHEPVPFRIGVRLNLGTYTSIVLLIYSFHTVVSTHRAGLIYGNYVYKRARRTETVKRNFLGIRVTAQTLL